MSLKNSLSGPLDTGLRFRLGFKHGSEAIDRIADNTRLCRDDGRMGAAAGLEFINDVPDMLFGRIQCNTQGCGDYLVGVSVPHESQHVHFPLGKMSRFGGTLGKCLPSVLKQVLDCSVQ